MKKYLCFLFCFIFFLSCEEKGGVLIPNEVSEIKISENAKVVSSDEAATIESIDESGTIKVSAVSPLAQAKKGDILIFGITDRTPEGWLRKATEVVTKDGKIEISTTQARLEDVVKEGTVDLSFQLTPEMGHTVSPLVDGVTFQQSALSIEKGKVFPIKINKVVLFDLDENLTTTEDQIVATGSVEMFLKAVFVADFGWSGLEHLRFGPQVEVTGDLAVSTAQFSLFDVDYRKEVAHYVFFPITIMAGLVPVVLVPELAVFVGVNGEITMEMAASAHESFSVDAGVEYKNGSWTLYSDVAANFTVNPPSLNGSGEIKAYAGPELKLKLYGVAGATASLDGYFLLEADIQTNPWWTLTAGLEGRVGIKIEILSYVLASFETDDLINWKEVIAQADGPFGCQPDCVGKECGDDGCEGNCGECPDGYNCQSDKCVKGPCQPNCAGKECGDNGCKGSCGNCSPGYNCVSGNCIEGPCKPNCAGKECGDDGCKGSCGECKENVVCKDYKCISNCQLWSKNYGSDDNDWGKFVYEVATGGYIIGGGTSSKETKEDYRVIKINESGSIIWDKIYGSTDSEKLYDMEMILEGGYVLAGTVGKDKSKVLKINQEGKVMWDKIYEVGRLSSIEQTSDGGYITSFNSGISSDPAVIQKLDANGEIKWNVEFTGLSSSCGDSLEDVKQANDGEYIAVGYTTKYAGKWCSHRYYWVIKFTEYGTINWEKTFQTVKGDKFNLELNFVEQTKDQGYILSGFTTNADIPETLYELIKLDENGNIIWQKTYEHGSEISTSALNIHQLGSGNYIAAGFKVYLGNTVGWVVNFDNKGVILWDKTYGKDDDFFYDVQVLSSGGYIAVGRTKSMVMVPDKGDIWVVKLDNNGNILCQ